MTSTFRVTEILNAAETNIDSIETMPKVSSGETEAKFSGIGVDVANITFKIVPLSESYARAIRETRKDHFGHEVVEQVATGRGPCRVSLRPFSVGKDSRLLFSHSPFTFDNAFNQPGPIFINSQEVSSYADIHRFPPEIKADKEHFQLTLIGYDSEQMMIYSKLVGNDDVDELISRIFYEHPTIEYLHARSASACCYICKIERA